MGLETRHCVEKTRRTAMGKVKPLFSTKKLFDKPKANKQDKQLQQGIVTNETEHELYMVADYKEFVERMPKIEANKCYQFVSFGQWSLKHVVFHILKLIGTADVVSTTYGLGPSSARAILSGLEKNIMKSFNFIYDWKVKQYKEEAHNLCENNFPVKITSIHAKITTLINDDWGITITGSANWSDKNRKIEHTLISTNKQSAIFHRDLLIRILNAQETEPKKIMEELKGI